MTSRSWRFASTYVIIPRENIDTDQIIPARFLTTTDRKGLGPRAFHDWRYLPDGSKNPDFVLNQLDSHGAEVLVAGHNFGCGSSREHAVWALAGAGFRAVISSGFADIFRGNALVNGLLPIEVPPEIVARLMANDVAGQHVMVDLETQTLTLPDYDEVQFPIPAFSRYSLLNGTDEMSFLLDASPSIGAYESAHPSAIDTTLLRVAR